MSTEALPEGIIRTPEGVYVLAKDTHLSRWIEEHKRLDIADGEITRFAKYIPVGGTVVDAGASLGDHTATYAKLVGPEGLVAAFEPNPLPYQALRLNFHGVNQVIGFPWGLSDREERASIEHEENVGASKLTPADGTDPGTTVHCLTLDEVMDFTKRLDFIHLDCEGYEVKALRGALNLIRTHRPVIVCEINRAHLARLKSSPSDIFDFLTSLNYRFEELTDRPNPETLEQRDILAIPRERPE